MTPEQIAGIVFGCVGIVSCVAAIAIVAWGIIGNAVWRRQKYKYGISGLPLPDRVLVPPMPKQSSEVVIAFQSEPPDSAPMPDA